MHQIHRHMEDDPIVGVREVIHGASGQAGSFDECSIVRRRSLSPTGADWITFYGRQRYSKFVTGSRTNPVDSAKPRSCVAPSRRSIGIANQKTVSAERIPRRDVVVTESCICD
jgi:hypothetical protein